MAFTFFFRDEQVLSLTVQNLIPIAMGRKTVHILNAGCAMGMETYTICYYPGRNVWANSHCANVKIQGNRH
jgi:chemotaxis methyl-accepting protein methylase